MWADEKTLARRRRRQRAKFERWFGRGDFGQFYYDRSSRARRIDPDVASHWIDQAMEISDAYFAKADKHAMIGGLCGVFSVMVLARWIPFIHQHIPSFLLAVAILDLCYLIWLYFEDYRKPLNALRERIEHALGAATPYPEEIAAPYRRRNLWMIPLVLAAPVLLIVFELAHGGWIMDKNALWMVIAGAAPAILLAGWLATRTDKALLAERNVDADADVRQRLP